MAFSLDEFAGGVARGLERGQRTNVFQQNQRLAQQKEFRARQQQVLDQATKQRDATAKGLEDLIAKAGVIRQEQVMNGLPEDPSMLTDMIPIFVKQHNALAEVTGGIPLDERIVTARMVQSFKAGLTPQETQAQELEQKKAEGALAIDQAVTKEQRLIDLGLKRDPNLPAPANFNAPGIVVDLKTGKPTGELAVLNPNTGQQVIQGTDDPIPAGTGVVKVEVAAESTGSALGISSKDQEAAAKESIEIRQSFVEIGQLFRAVDEAGQGVTGLRGVGIEVLGGLAGQISPQFESAIAQGLGGVTPEQVREFRLRARAQIAKLVPVFTAEEGARISDRELQISSIASGLLSPTASITQIRAAIPLIMELKLSDQMKQDLIAGRPLSNDLSTPEGINTLGNKLLGFGMPQSTITGMLRDLAEVQKELQE